MPTLVGWTVRGHYGPAIEMPLFGKNYYLAVCYGCDEAGFFDADTKEITPAEARALIDLYPAVDWVRVMLTWSEQRRHAWLS